MLIDPLTKRWLTGDYSHYLTEFKKNKVVARRHPKSNGYFYFRNVYLRRTRLSDTYLCNSCLDSGKAFESTLPNCNFENILTVILDNSNIPGLVNTKSYLNGKVLSPSEIAECFYKKLQSDYNEKGPS